MKKIVSRFICAALGLGALATSTLAQTTYEPYTFTTFAGLAGYGSTNGIGSAARFYQPAAVAADSAGNLYVADTANNIIRKITTAGVVTTLAGQAGSTGSINGTGSAARFNFPVGIASDGAGTLYVADANNNMIRKITSAGAVTTLAGEAGVAGSNNGTGTAAHFSGPSGVSVDANGVVYVADTFNNTIRKITSAGVVTTLAGSGTSGDKNGMGTAAQFSVPQDVAVDSTGNVYVADTGNELIRKITSGGTVTTLAGMSGFTGSNNGTGTSAQFNEPGGVAVDTSGNIYVADSYNHTIRKITSGGAVTTLAGTPDPNGEGGYADATGSAARFSYPFGVVVSGGNIYVADSNNNSIRKVTTAGVVSTFAGPGGARGSVDGAGSAARFDYPSGIAVDNAGNAYVADNGSNVIRKITANGVVTTLAGLAYQPGSANGTGNVARFTGPVSVAVDGSGNLYVADSGNNTIRKITAGGTVSTLAGMAGVSGNADGFGSAAHFANPMGVTVDGAGNVYVADTGNGTIRKITPNGSVTTLAGAANTPTAGAFNLPRDVAADFSGNVYVCDQGDYSILKVSPAGGVALLAGSEQGSADGTGSDAQFQDPRGVAVDPAGNVYVADTSNRTIRKITPTGVVTTLAGVPLSDGNSDGTGSAVRFQLPGDLAVDQNGFIYVADTANQTIRIGASSPRLTSVARLPNGHFVLSGLTLPNMTNIIDISPTLSFQFKFTDSFAPGANRAFQYEDAGASMEQIRFYRFHFQ